MGIFIGVLGTVFGGIIAIGSIPAFFAGLALIAAGVGAIIFV